MKNRIKLCIRSLRNHKLDSLLISDPINISYLTGFRSADGFLLLSTEGKLTYFTNFIYSQEAKELKVWDVAVCPCDIFTNISKCIIKQGLKNVGFEAKHLPFMEYKKISQAACRNKVNFADATEIISEQRAIKSKNELSLIKQSALISKDCFNFIDEIKNKAMTEEFLSVETEHFLKLKGDSETAFKTIVASGKNSAKPHHIPNTKVIGSDIFITDLGSKYYGYCADLTRVFFWDRMPTYIQKVYAAVKKAHEAGIRAAKEGVRAKDLDLCARSVIEKKGFGKFFGHGLGHGVGLCVHEDPFINPYNETLLKSGMVITIEPAVYIPKQFGIRVESMILVTETKAQVLDGNINW
ncbi:MAG: Xaa-Pro peptidase family protein [Candidatus Omnitrophota bacterium]